MYPCSVELNMCEPTCDYRRLLVRELTQICIIGLPYLSHIWRKKIFFYHHCTLLFVLVFLE